MRAPRIHILSDEIIPPSDGPRARFEPCVLLQVFKENINSPTSLKFPVTSLAQGSRMGFAIHHPSVTWHVQSLCVLIILIKQSANTSDGRILLHMSIMVWKIDKSTISRLTFSETDFDSITKRLPSGLYTTFRTFAQHTKVIGLSAHLARLYQPAKAQGLVIVRTQRKLRQILAQLLNSMGTDEARLRIVLDTTSEPGTLYVMMQVFQVLPEKLYHEGACVALSARSREEPKLKKTQFISASATERECIGGDVFEILLTHRGRILEGMTSNFFYVCGETLGTAARGVLLGVTRGTVLALARQAEIPDPLSGVAM